jgi:hypothetical protein
MLLSGIALIKHYKGKLLRKQKNTTLKTFSLTVGVLFVLAIHIVSWHLIIYDIGRTVTGSFAIIAKEVDSQNRTYFIIEHTINDYTIKGYPIDYQDSPTKKIQCSNDVYNALIVDNKVRYFMVFRTLSLKPEMGLLEKIDTVDYIDNR